MLQSFNQIMRDFISFIKSPSEQKIMDYPKMFLVKTFLAILVLDILIMAALTFLIDSFNEFGWISIENHQISLLLETIPIWLALLLTILLLPLIEEIFFRFPLRYNRNYLLRLLMKIKLRNVENTNEIPEFWISKFPYIFYTSTIVFASLHLLNFDLQTTIIYLIPILILPQFILALFIGYLRLKFNFLSGFLLHSVHNSIFIVITLLTINNSVIKLDVDNNLFSLKIEEVNRKESSSFDIVRDSIRFEGINLKNIISTLTNKEDFLIEFEQNTKLKKHLSLIIKNKSNQNIDLSSIILNQLSKLYDFKIDSIKRTTKFYKLNVFDSLKLSKHSLRTTSDSSSTSNIGVLLTLDNVTLEVLARELSYHYKIRFEIADNNYYFLNMKLPNNNLRSLESILKQDYGINLEKSEKEIEHIYVRFNK